METQNKSSRAYLPENAQGTADGPTGANGLLALSPVVKVPVSVTESATIHLQISLVETVLGKLSKPLRVKRNENALLTASGQIGLSGPDAQ